MMNDRNLPPLPPGFELEPVGALSPPDGGLPPLPPGFELEAPQQAPASMQGQNRQPQFDGAAMNATAGANETLYSILGAPVDLKRGAMNMGIRGFNAVTGSDVGQIPEDSFGGSRSIGQAMGAIRPELDPQNTQANTMGERVARGAGQGLAGAVVPAGIVGGLARAGTLAPRAAGMAEAIVGAPSSVSNAVLGTTSGAGGAIGQEIAPEGYEPLGAFVGGMAGGVAGAGGMAAARSGQTVMRPFTPGGQQRMAGERILTGASDPEAVRQSLNGNPDQLVPGSQPTTFQQTGDLGLGVMEKNAANRQPEAFAQRRADQNEARIGAMRGIEPAGAPEKVAASVRQHLEGIEAETERMMTEATDAARSRTSAIGSPMTPDVAGGNMRGAIETARAQMKTRERALWNAVDPDGTMALGLSNTRQTAADIAKEHSSFSQPMTDTERQIYGAIGQAGEMVPLRAMQDLQSNLKAAMRAERSTNGESPAYRRMSILSAGIAKDFDAAVAGKVAQEAQAVAAGQMSPDQTTEAAVMRAIDEWRAGKADAVSGQSVVGLSGNVGADRAASVPPVFGGQGQSRGGFPNAPGDPRLSVDAGAPLFDRAAQERLELANAITRRRAATFDNDTLAPFRARPSNASPYDYAAGTLPQRIFNGSKGSYEAIGQLRAAIGPQAADDALQGYATGELLRVAGRPDGTIDPAKLATFRRTHADALRALPGLDARLSDAGRASEAIAQVATSRAAASRDAQKGALGRLIGVDAPEDVSRIVGSVFSVQDGVARMQSIRQAIGNDPEAAQGLRRAVIEHMAGKFIGNTEAATSGLGTMKSDGFQTFTRQNRGALEAAGFTPDDLGTLDAIAADLQRSGRSIASVKNPGGSDTAQNIYGAMRGNTPFGALARFLAAPGAAGVGLGIANGTATGLAAGAAAGVFTAMRNAGLRTVDDLVADALLNPERARLLLSKVPEGQEGARLEELIRSFGQSAVRSLGVGADAPAEPERRTERAATPTQRVAEALMQSGARSSPPMNEKRRRVAEALMQRKAA